MQAQEAYDEDDQTLAEWKRELQDQKRELRQVQDDMRKYNDKAKQAHKDLEKAQRKRDKSREADARKAIDRYSDEVGQKSQEEAEIQQNIEQLEE